MLRRPMRSSFPAIALCAALLSACGGAGAYSPPASAPAGPTDVPPLVIGLALPSGTIGIENDPVFGAVGGFTQQTYSQVLAFAPGTTVRIQNLSASTVHTLNVIGTVSGAPAFPSAPLLSTAAAGTPGVLDASYASGNIAAGALSAPLTLTAGAYYLGCAYHYAGPTNMRSVLVVSAGATPGPQATPASGSGGAGACSGAYC